MDIITLKNTSILSDTKTHFMLVNYSLKLITDNCQHNIELFLEDNVIYFFV